MRFVFCVLCPFLPVQQAITKSTVSLATRISGGTRSFIIFCNVAEVRKAHG